MRETESPPLRSHLADFETTTSHLLRPGQARALLNFAALFHEVIYLTDTALGDSQLIIDSFRQETSRGLFHQISRLIQEGILHVLCRDKIVVRGKVLVPHDPTIREIFEGWQYRDRVEWGGEPGYTATVEDRVRLSYFREVDQLLSHRNAIHRYNPDIPKSAFRNRIREHLGRDATLSKSLARLPAGLRRKYLKATQDQWFTNAELWRVLKRTDSADEAIILHAHINQQCYADLTESGQSAHDRSVISLASFNLELQHRHPLALEVDATLAPPKNLEELLDSAPVKLRSPGIEMFERLPIEKVIALRRRAKPMFDLARRVVRTPQELEDLRRQHLRALEGYWGYICQTFEEMFPEKLLQPSRLALFLEREVPPLNWLYQKFGKSIFAMLLRLVIPGASGLSASSGLLSDAVHSLGVLFVQERSDEDLTLRHTVPPMQWRPRGILGLDRMVSVSAPDIGTNTGEGL